LQSDNDRPDRLAFRRNFLARIRRCGDKIALDVSEQCEGLIESHRQRHSPRNGEPYPHLFTHDPARKPALPSKQREQLASLHQVHGAFLDPAQPLLHVACGKSVLDCFHPHFARCEPASRPSIELRHFVGISTL